jgi:pantoate--beta-alanine ligase
MSETSSPLLLSIGADIRAAIMAARRNGETVGLVPTMGALHVGHVSLVRTAKAQCDRVVATVFVNPTQFGPQEDFNRYPRDLERDRALLAKAGCDWVFAPSTDEMYPLGSDTMVHVGAAAAEWEGRIRPTHFAGVATVVLKLFNLAPADRAYFGRKDYQQTVVVRQMVRDLNVPIEIVICPTVREPDGLAMSSRNAYLSPTERQHATALRRSLLAAEELVALGESDVEVIRARMESVLVDVDHVQYIAFLRDGTMESVDRIAGPTVIALAAKVGATRLIDNTLVGD